MLISRRGLVTAAASASIAPFAFAQAASKPDHAGYAPWSPPKSTGLKAPLEKMVDLGGKQLSIGEWMAGQPAVLSLWATWCGPCLAEKLYQAKMSARLVQANTRLRFLAIQAFDDVSLRDARKVLKKLGADTLTNARASGEAEKAFVSIFGKSPVEPWRTSMPALLLVTGDGEILGSVIGMMPSIEGKDSYWADDTTFDFLSKL